MATIAATYAGARPGGNVIGWTLNPDQREELLARFRPKYANVVAHHVTLRPKVSAAAPLPPPVDARIVGWADDGRGVETLVVAIDSGTGRPDGGTYHVTWSLAPSRRAKESNDVIARQGWDALAEPVPLDLEPACFR